jgi:hypothetical protein
MDSKHLALAMDGFGLVKSWIHQQKPTQLSAPAYHYDSVYTPINFHHYHNFPRLYIPVPIKILPFFLLVHSVMHDLERNQVYRLAIEKEVKEDDFVLDIGTGISTSPGSLLNKPFFGIQAS